MPPLDDDGVTDWSQSPGALTSSRSDLWRTSMLRVITTALTLFFAGAALADEWKEYGNRDYGFTVHFPGDPTTETATYKVADGRSFPVHVFLVKQETGVFKVT